MGKRRYTDEERAAALAALAANGGNVKQTAVQQGIPLATLESWASGRRHPEAMTAAIQKRGDLADAIEQVVFKIVDALPGKVKDAELKDTAVALGVLIDKMRLLRGESTSITESQNDSRLDEFRRRYQKAFAPDAPESSEQDTGAESVSATSADASPDSLPGLGMP